MTRERAQKRRLAGSWAVRAATGPAVRPRGAFRVLEHADERRLAGVHCSRAGSFLCKKSTAKYMPSPSFVDVCSHLQYFIRERNPSVPIEYITDYCLSAIRDPETPWHATNAREHEDYLCNSGAEPETLAAFRHVWARYQELSTVSAKSS